MMAVNVPHFRTNNPLYIYSMSLDYEVQYPSSILPNYRFLQPLIELSKTIQAKSIYNLTI